MFKDFFDEIKKIVKESIDDFIEFPKRVNTILDEQNSNWAFTITINNTTTADKVIALLHGDISAKRFALVNSSNQYQAIGGGLITTAYAENTTVLLDDNTLYINKYSGNTVDCVADQLINNAAVIPAQITQTIFKDGTGSVTFTSKEGNWNHFRENIKKAPVRVFEIQMNTTNSSLFQKTLKLKDMHPFKKTDTEEIQLEDYSLPEYTNDTKIIIPLKFYLTEQTYLDITLPPATEVTLTFKLSAIHSTGIAIRRKLKAEEILSTIAKTQEKPKTLNSQFAQKQTTNTEL